MRILVVTSCTSEKAVKNDRQLTLEDFRQGPDHVAVRERELSHLMLPAEALYTGQQHVRLMRGVRTIREANDEHLTVDVYILSAGYGLVTGGRKVAPYQATFQGMKKKELRAWADVLDIPAATRKLLVERYDLGLVLLGDPYLEASALDDQIRLGGPTLLFCGSRAFKRLPDFDGMKPVVLTNKEAKRFSCGLVALKGEMGARVLRKITADRATTAALTAESADVLALLEEGEPSIKPARRHARANPAVDHVIQIPKSWWDKPHRKQLRYFIPEWDDLVDPDYDFETDTHSGGSGDWSNEVYAHQLYAEPNYDGILMSRAVAEKGKKKDARINQMGVHRFLRVPRNFPIMGDCGAFDYIEEKEPPYTTDDVVDYYTRLDFDYGVSVDHLIVPAFYADKEFRYDLTIHNAEAFLKEHRKRGLAWEPIGAVQGWDPGSYARAAAAYIKMGYKYLGLGGLVRSSTKKIVQVLKEVAPVLKPGTNVHLFGIARPEALPTFAALGVTSVDSASHLRRAWLVAHDNYFSLDGTSYSAIRIPEVGRSFRTKRMIKEGRATEAQLLRLQRKALDAVTSVDQGRMRAGDAVCLIEDYDRLIGEDRDWMGEQYRRTLEDKPWKNCSCEICKSWGVQVMIFRGNNRNRRRGFHNTYVFYRLMQQALLGKATLPPEASQTDLFKTAQVA